MSGRNTFHYSLRKAKPYVVDYNSWIESDTGRKLADSLDKDVVLAEGTLSSRSCYADSRLMIALGYKEYDTKRKYLVTLGDWRNNKDEEVELDGIGGVNILVKADVHRSGEWETIGKRFVEILTVGPRHQFPMLRIREPGRNRGLCQDGKTSWLSSCGTTKLRGLAHRH